MDGTLLAALSAGWGVILAMPVVRRARRDESTRRARALGSGVGPGERAARGAMRKAASKVAHGTVGRVAASLATRRRRRRADASLAQEVPVVVDLLAVAVGSGYTPYLAVEAARRWAPPTIASLLGRVQRSCALGVSFADSLAELAATAPRLSALADALSVSGRTGAPVGRALAALAVEERASVRREAEVRARAVPVRLLFPLVFLVLPAFGLLTVVPALLAGFART